jgi:hypothetical protein
VFDAAAERDLVEVPEGWRSFEPSVESVGDA